MNTNGGTCRNYLVRNSNKMFETRPSFRRYACYSVGAFQVILLLCALLYIQQITDYNTTNTSEVETHSVQEEEKCHLSQATRSEFKPHVVFGILTTENERELRDAQRNTWIKSATQADIPFQLTYRFLIDNPTDTTISENKIYNDILYLNATHSGYAVRFGEKLYRWWKYVYEQYPDALLAARIDVDAFLCVPQIFQRLYELKSSKLYYGWAHGKGNKIGVLRRVDEMFVVLGRDLVERIAKRKYCEEKTECDAKKNLVDTNYGGTSIGEWLSIYSDIDFHPDNERIIQFGRSQFGPKFAAYIREGFCEKRLVFHKATAEIMKQLNGYNKNVISRINTKSEYDATTGVLEGAITGSLFSGSETRQLLPLEQYSKIPARVVKDDIQSCANWAVVTTIFKPSGAVTRIAKTPNWCLVIVADKQTPGKDVYLKGIASNRVKYLSTDDQLELYPTLAETIPYKHFGRKNIGYIYAMHHNAKMIWDFDDDNLGVVDINDFNATTSNLVTACDDFKGDLLNPYPYFGVKDNMTWPRGLPLQHIKDTNIIPKICQTKEKIKVGVVQSLANEQPDVDAIFRLTRDVPFNFTAKKETHPAFLVPRKVYTPFNAQATLWMRHAFLYMALPLTVNGRVSDIWRSYIALHFMHREGIQLAFSFPYVIQQRNEHMDIKDFNAERHLYERSEQLVQFLSSKEAGKIESLMNMYEHLYRRGYIELNDLKFMDAWTKTINIITER